MWNVLVAPSNNLFFVHNNNVLIWRIYRYRCRQGRDFVGGLGVHVGHLLRPRFRGSWSIRRLQISATGKMLKHDRCHSVLQKTLHWFMWGSCTFLLLSAMPWQSYMDSEIRAIMAQYMPLENQETSSHQRHVDHADIWDSKEFYIRIIKHKSWFLWSRPWLVVSSGLGAAVFGVRRLVG